LVESNIEETEQFIYDTDPARVDHQRAVQDLAILSSALPKLAWGCGK
jgi:cell fate regulator YaaT (PSP1 superfamily)